MNYGVIVAGGVGKRMGADIPKQYMMIGNKPIIVYSIERFVKCNELAKTIVLTPADWASYTKELLKKHLTEDMMQRVEVIQGGRLRNDTIMKAINYIESEYGLDEDTIIVTHDAVRPFVTSRMIKENIEAAKKYGAANTVVAATNTILESKDGETISRIPERMLMYQVQTPQTFKALELRKTYNMLTENEREELTDAAKIYVLKNKPVKLVEGENYNIKITYPMDLKIAETLLKQGT